MDCGGSEVRGDVMDQALADQAVQVIITNIRKTRNKMGCGFLFILTFGIGIIYLSLTTDEGGTGMIIFGALMILLAAFGAKIVWPNLNPEKAPLVTLLRESPENIAWVYDTPDPGPRGRTVTHTIHVQDVDRKHHSFMVKVAEVEGMIEVMKAFAPKATVGFSKENSEKYGQDPRSMIDGGEG
jgi:hypothetical protein